MTEPHLPAPARECPVARALEAIGDRWSLLILRDAFDGIRRFSEFQKNLGVAKNILATRLKTLVEVGLFEIRPASDGSAYKEYVLTERGRAVFPVVVCMRQWGERFLFAPGETHSVLLDRHGQQPVLPLEVRSTDGRLLGPEDCQRERTTTPLSPERDVDTLQGDIPMSASNDRKIDNIEFNVSDIARSKAFYGSAFGWTFVDYGPTYTEFSDGRLTGGLTTGEAVRPGGPLVILYADDLAETRSRLIAAGATISRETFAFPGGRRFHFIDPDGYELAVWSASEPHD